MSRTRHLRASSVIAGVLSAGLLLACGQKQPQEQVIRGQTSVDDAGVTLRSAQAVDPKGAPRVVRVAPALVQDGRVHTVPVVRRKPTGIVHLPANVVASPEGAAEAGALLAGRVARFECREGDHVKRGQVLAWLDSPEAAHATADLIRAKTRTETQARKVARLEGLVASEAATQVALDDARMDLDLARADLSAARTIVTSLALTTTAGAAGDPIPAQLPVRSPVDGIVVERGAALGAHVAPQTRLFRLVTEGRVLVEARITEGSSIALSPSDVAHVDLRGARPAGAARTEKGCTAKVLGVLPEVDPQTRTRTVRLMPDGGAGSPCARLVAGAQADVEIEVAPSATAALGDVLVVPAWSAVELKTATIVFIKTREPGVFDVRPIEPGIRIGEDLVINAGVTEGEEIVATGAILLKGELMRSELGGDP